MFWGKIQEIRIETCQKKKKKDKKKEISKDRYHMNIDLIE